MSFRKITVKSGDEESTLEVTEEEYQKYYQSNPSFLWCRILTLFWRVGKWENKL